MTHPAGWTTAEPCPSCGSWDITEYEIHVGSSEIRMGWECRDCGHLASWTTRASTAPDLANERQLLSVMPLHAITTMYGEQGLRERFALETAWLADPAARGQVKRALWLAARLHASDHRQREPYVNHLLRVALRIMVHYGIREPDMICAALLHDSVEDHAEDLSAAGRRGAFALLAAAYGERVAELVAAVTNPVYTPGSDADGQYREHVADSLDACLWARVIKISDFTDNGIGLIHTTGKKAVRLARKYAPLVPALADLAARPDTPLTDEVKARILGQLRRASGRFDAIIAASRDSTDFGGR
jgi:HD domain